MGTWMGHRHVLNITDVSGDVLLCSRSSKWVPRDDLAVTDHLTDHRSPDRTSASTTYHLGRPEVGLTMLKP